MKTKGVKKSSRYGTLGLNVGVFGRWTRLVYGVFLLFPLLIQLPGDFTKSVSFLSLVLFYFLIITLAYVVGYLVFGKFFEKANVWVNTAIFVGPVIALAYWNFLFAWTGVTFPGAFNFALIFYISISLILQFSIKYGGCEVVSIPILLTRRRYRSFCIPLVAVDAVEKAVVDRKTK